MLTKDFFFYFRDLEKNNNKEWFDANRKRYELLVKEPFKNLVEELIVEMSAKDEPIHLTASDMIFRINRDIRFSKDKTPYKTNVAAIISKMGRKGHHYPGYYLHIDSKKMSLGGGAYFLEPSDLKKIRQEIIYNPLEFKKIVSDKSFVSSFSSIQGEKSKTLGKEYADEVAKQPLLLNKQFYFMAEFPASAAMDKSAASFISKHFLKAKKLNDFLRRALD